MDEDHCFGSDVSSSRPSVMEMGFMAIARFSYPS
jgi:hypothetical protein